MTSKQLARIEDGVHRQLKRLQAAVEVDASLRPLHENLLAAWGAMYREVKEREEREAAQDGGGEVICTVFSHRAGAQLCETQICRRIVRRRYGHRPEARWFVDVIREVVTVEDLSRHLREAKGTVAA